jgi:hypothetical protein
MNTKKVGLLACLILTLASSAALALPESRFLRGGNLWTQRAPNGKLLCEVWQLMNRSNLITWELSHVPSNVLNITVHRRTNLTTAYIVGSATVTWNGSLPANWFPGMPIPIVTSNWFALREFHLKQFDTGGSQGAITLTSTNPANPCLYTKISRMRHRAIYSSTGSPCEYGEAGTLYYVYRTGRAAEAATSMFVGAATHVSPGGSNEVVVPFPINNYWHMMTAHVCSGCYNPCWDPAWGTPGNIVIGSTTWSMPGFALRAESSRLAGILGSPGAPVYTNTVPVSLTVNRFATGFTSSRIEIPAPTTGSLGIESTSDLKSWQAVSTRISSDGYVVADTPPTTNSGSAAFRLITEAAVEFPAPALKAAAAPGENWDHLACIRATSSEMRPVPLYTLDLVRYLAFIEFHDLD